MNKMSKELDAILGDSNENNKNGVDRMIELLQELRVEFACKMEDVCKPKYKTSDPIDVLLIEDLTTPEKLIMVVLRNRDEATLPQIQKLTGFTKVTGNKALNSLRNKGLVIKVRVGTYKINETKIC
jgi:hypothetical protein